MLIITLHGFGSTGTGSTICSEIAELAKENGATVYSPTYPTNNPHLAGIYLTNYVSNKIEDHNESPIYIGFDLGGFWARKLASVAPPTKLFMINPDLEPWESLRPYVGQNRNSSTNELFELAPNDVAAFHIYRVERDHMGLKACLITSQSDTVSEEDRKVELLSGIKGIKHHSLPGDHSFSQNRQDVLDIIRNDLFPEEGEDQ